MSQVVVARTGFTGGELAPELRGRTDARVYEQGAGRLRNVIVQPTGGVTRRPGTRYLATVPAAPGTTDVPDPGPGRLVPFDNAEAGAALLLFDHFLLRVFKDGALVTALTTIWPESALAELTFAQSQDGLLVCHGGYPPKRITDDDGVWAIRDWSYASDDDGTHQPYARFADADIILDPDEVGSTIVLRTSAPVFTSNHYGAIVRIKRREVRLTSVASATEASGIALQPLVDLDATRDWDEQAFGPAHGYPRSATFHQGRLVIGGSRDKPDAVWLSKSGQPFNFDLGSGLDDEAVAFELKAERPHRILSAYSGRDLVLFTDHGEWICAGRPITPGDVRLSLQTRIGSISARRIPPQQIEGAILFLAGNGRELREFVFADIEQAYRAADLALLSRHLLQDPRALVFDPDRRLVLILREDGQLAAMTLDRSTDTAAWSLLATEGTIASLARAGDVLYALVERDGQILLERFEDGLMVDAARSASQATAKTEWSGFGHLEGQDVQILTDNGMANDQVSAGSVHLVEPSTSVTVGLPYTHEIEPLPGDIGQARGGFAARARAVRTDFQLLETGALKVDTGKGPQPMALGGAPQSAFTGDVQVRALGWHSGSSTPAWRIIQDEPWPMTLLSVTTTYKVNV